MGSSGELTDQNFWSEQWKERKARRVLQRVLHGKAHGKGGGFLSMWQRYVGRKGFDGESVLEIGGAVSQYLIDFALEGGAVVALDYNAEGIQQTQELFEQRNVRGRTILADALTFAGERFDVVTHWGVLEHFEDPLPIIEASGRLVKPDGVVVFGMPNLEAAGAALWKRYSPSNFSAHICHSDAGVDAACKKAGLRLDATYRIGMPLVRMAPLESRGIGALVVNATHALLCAVGAAVPTIYRYTPAALANYRLFIARPI